MSRMPVTLSLAALMTSGAAMAEVPRVATDIAPVHALVARVMDGVGSPDLIVQPGGSPHEYSLRPSEAAALQDAEIVFWIGEDLTPWLTDAIGTLAGDAAVTALLDLDGTQRLGFRESALFEAHAHGHEEAGHDDHGHDETDHDDHGHDEAGHDDHGHEETDHDDHGHEETDHDDHGHDEAGQDEDHGHDHGECAVDPHAWLSPDNAALWLGVIADELSRLDPDNAPAYAANAAAGRDELAALAAEIGQTLDPVRNRSFVVFHDAYQYFESAFGIAASGAISLSDASDPSPARIAEIQGRVAEQGIACVLSEPQFAPGIVEAVMAGTQARTAVLDPLGSDVEPGPAFYPQMMRNLAGALVGCLE